MDTFLIIDKTDFEGHIDVSTNLNATKKLSMHILHAQDFDLCKLMGDAFYYSFMSTFSADNVQRDDAPQVMKDLYTGATYDVGEATWINPGIKPVLVYFAGARLMQNLNIHITPNLVAQKLNDFSEAVSTGAKQFAINTAENQAVAYWRKVVTYMNTVKGSYPLFFTGCGCDSGGSNILRPKRVAVGASDSEYVSERSRRIGAVPYDEPIRVQAIFQYTENDIDAGGYLVLRAADAAIARNLTLLSSTINNVPASPTLFDKNTNLISGFGNWIGQYGSKIVLKFI